MDKLKWKCCALTKCNQWINSLTSRIIWVCTDNLNNKIFKVIILKICTAINLVNTFWTLRYLGLIECGCECWKCLILHTNYLSMKTYSVHRKTILNAPIYKLTDSHLFSWLLLVFKSQNRKRNFINNIFKRK